MIELGRNEASKPVRLDVDHLITSRMLLQANSGGGKSWALRRLLEQTHGKVQQIVIDTEGEFYTLREKLDYVLCGKGGDCPAEPRSAAMLARKLLELNCSAVIDIYELAPHERVKFVRLFVEALVDAPRALWHPALIVIDEAHYYAPQRGEAESFNAVAALMSKGRKRGYCGVLATQRLAKLHKDVAAEANNVVIGRTRLDVDRKRAAEDLGFATKAESLALQKMKPGEFFAFGPAFAHDDVARTTIGSVKTSHPKAGTSAAPPAPPRAKVRSILGELADLPAEAEEEARTVEDLQTKVREQQREIRRLEKANPIDPKALDDAKARGFDDGVEFARREIADASRRLEDDRRKHSETLTAALEQMGQVVDGLSAPLSFAQSNGTPPARRTTATKPVRAVASPRSRAPSENGDVDGPMQRILDAIAWLESANLPAPFSRIQVAFIAGYKPGSGGFNNPLGRLRGAGLIAYPVPGRVALTDEGGAVANAPNAPLTQSELHDRVRQRIDGPMWRILEPLITSYPQSMSKRDLADAAGYTFGSGGFNNPLGRLRSLGLIAYPSAGEAVALEVLFP